ncbi:c-type cytochrome [Olleya sp. R77988]|uniref:c-type cytochrome n=1 Tax=Olleya sp. R77988 TaxID=3093875 RepID=UPI0037C5844C
MKKSTNIIFVFTIIITFLFSCGTKKDTSNYQDKPTVDKNTLIYQVNPTVDKNLLAAYGQKIYNREQCNQCHTQHIENKSYKLVSLDGIGNKYSNEWLSAFLYDPKAIIHNAKMPAYKKLLKTSLDKTILTEIAKENKWTIDQETLWENLIHEANLLSDSFKYESKPVKKEALALIAYLQKVPISKELGKIYDAEDAKIVKNNSKWDGIKNQDGAILKIIDDKKSVALGEKLFRINCAACHMQDGRGGIGPNLTDNYWIQGGNKTEIAKAIAFGGRPGKGMIEWKAILTPIEIGHLTAYIHSLKGTNPENAKAPEGEKE